ncbi:unnamed protein product [Kuraishia capsulata CBS 1993]|uniref:Manganese transporter SMF2 n=1 Tax=Kuraishia capsulata CBS 1993 TaxID=1382522 RepID=W6MQS8_9ASCO|nr:uncharacterized protein KUCA_T00005007001 [Kuraishia capsulata CBS 1993]CDK29021.1 unnamed protein product [Kuraishia capsulata CBS 1993]
MNLANIDTSKRDFSTPVPEWDDHGNPIPNPSTDSLVESIEFTNPPNKNIIRRSSDGALLRPTRSVNIDPLSPTNSSSNSADHINFARPSPNIAPHKLSWIQNVARILRKYLSYIGPGIMVSVAYMDPGNYSTAVAAGAAHKYKLLFSVLLANILAVFLQTLCAKLGSVTGLDLAQNCREHLPRKWNLFIYILAEIAIIATDLAEVVGTAISLNILFGIPLLAGVILTVIDVLIVLMAYRPNGPLFIIRIFEGFVSLLVVATVVCFAVELSAVAPTTDFGEVFRGFLPSEDAVKGDGLYLSLAILGATVMPHSLYLGSGLVQSRLRDFDEKQGNYVPPVEPVRSPAEDEETSKFSRYCGKEDDEIPSEAIYRPSLEAIDDAMSYTIAELVVSLFTVALFVNAAILIVAGSTLSTPIDDDDDGKLNDSADLFTIYHLLKTHLSKTAGAVFALALLCSGQSAGVVCTLAGQMVSEGFLRWSIPPAVRRLLTRAVAIAPCLVLVLVSGREGLSGALNASQVILSLLLPIVSAPLIYFTCNKNIMKVAINPKLQQYGGIPSYELEELGDESVELEDEEEILYKDMSNGTITAILAVGVWGFITILNFWLLFNLALGKDTPL